MLKRFKSSPNQREQEIFACMIHNLFDEYRFFHKYPEKELRITGILFGTLIQHQLVSFTSHVLVLLFYYSCWCLDLPLVHWSLFCFSVSLLMIIFFCASPPTIPISCPGEFHDSGDCPALRARRFAQTFVAERQNVPLWDVCVGPV